MPARFTDTSLRALKPQAERYDIREGDGFMVRVFPSGAKSFCYVYDHNGKRNRLTLGRFPEMSLKDARAAHRDAQSLRHAGINPATAKVEKASAARQKEEAARLATVAALCASYIERHAKQKKRSWKQDETILKNVLPYIGKRPAADITRREINALIDRIMTRGSPITANRTLSLLHKIYQFAIDRGELENNPCKGIPRPAPERARDRVLSDDELITLWHALKTGEGFKGGERVRIALQLQLLTACRIGEIIGARFSELDGKGWLEIPPERMKKGRPHRVWLGGTTASAMIARLRQFADGSPFLFPGETRRNDAHLTKSAAYTALTRSMAALGLAHCSTHDLRRTAATRFGEIGIPPHIIARLLSHQEGGITTAHYNRFSYDAEKARALERWEARLLEITEGRPPATVLPFAPAGAAPLKT